MHPLPKLFIHYRLREGERKRRAFIAQKAIDVAAFSPRSHYPTAACRKTA